MKVIHNLRNLEFPEPTRPFRPDLLHDSGNFLCTSLTFPDQGDLSFRKIPVSPVKSFQRVRQCHPFLLIKCRHLHHKHASTDAIFIPHPLTRRTADAFLIGKEILKAFPFHTGNHPADILESCECLKHPDSVCLADSFPHIPGHNGFNHRSVFRKCARFLLAFRHISD